MHEITIVRTPNIIAAEINSIKEQTQKIMLCNSIEIGRRLAEAKSMVEHGQWGDWLKASVDYSQRTASNLVRIFEEYGDNQLALFGSNAKSQALANLTYTQAVALLGVTEDEREQFVQEHDMTSMSTRELQQVIKERDEFKTKFENTQTTAIQLSKERDKLREEAGNLHSSVRVGDQVIKEHQSTIKMLQGELEKERQHTKSEVDRLAGLLKEARNDGSSDEKVTELETKLKAAQAQVQKLTEELAKPVTLDPVVVEKVPEDIELELNALRERTRELEAKAGQQSNAAILKYGVYFESVVTDFKNLLGALHDIGQTDPEVHGKYKNAVAGLLDKMSEKL